MSAIIASDARPPDRLPVSPGCKLRGRRPAAADNDTDRGSHVGRSGCRRRRSRQRQPSHDWRTRYRPSDHASRQGSDRRHEGRLCFRFDLCRTARRRAAVDRNRPATSADSGGGSHGRCYRAHQQAARGSPDARRGARTRRDRREDAHDARRHRHDAERDGRDARAGDVAVAWGRERSHSGDARTLHAVSLRWTAALRRAGRRAWAAADSADGPWSGRSDQGGGFVAVWRRRDGRSRESDLPASRPQSRTASFCSTVRPAAPPMPWPSTPHPAARWGAVVARQRSLAGADRRERRRLGGPAGVLARRIPSPCVLGRWQRQHVVRDDRSHDRGPRRRNDERNSSHASGRSIHRGARIPFASTAGSCGSACWTSAAS